MKLDIFTSKLFSLNTYSNWRRAADIRKNVELLINELLTKVEKIFYQLALILQTIWSLT